MCMVIFSLFFPCKNKEEKKIILINYIHFIKIKKKIFIFIIIDKGKVK